MAESQVPYPYSEQNIDALKASLSPERFATYLARAGGNEPFAFALYLYNARLSKSLLFPLSVTEVTLRNAVDHALVLAHGEAWHLDEGFRDQVLTEQSREALERAISRVNRNSRGSVIAELTFDFWSNLFRDDYAQLWRTKANIAFPNLAHGEGRGEIQKLAKSINRVRNRVAHHEHILDVNIPEMLANMFKLTELRCANTSRWMRHHTTVNLVMRGRPSVSGTASQTFRNRADKNFLTVGPGDDLRILNLPGAKSCCAFVCVEGSKMKGAFTHKQALDFLAIKAAELDGLVDFKDFAVSELVSTNDIQQGAEIVDADLPFGEVVELLKKKDTMLVLGLGIYGEPIGIILRAHRRY